MQINSSQLGIMNKGENVTHLAESRLGKLTSGEYFIDASDLGSPIGIFPDCIEIIKEDYMINRFENPRKRTSGYPDYELLSIQYFSANNEILTIRND